MKKKNPIEEARRYVDNARQVLNENAGLNTETGHFEDEKYVRAAGHYLWHAMLISLDAVFQVRKDRRTRVDINDYLNAVSKRDHKLLDWVDDGYTITHLYMGYDGIRQKKICDEGFRLANMVIDRCAAMLPQVA